MIDGRQQEVVQVVLKVATGRGPTYGSTASVLRWRRGGKGIRRKTAVMETMRSLGARHEGQSDREMHKAHDVLDGCQLWPW